VATITSKFAARGLSVEQMVALSGAHTIGLAHCSAFSNRLSPTLDSTLASPLAQSLLTLCPSGSNNTTNLDVTTPTKFDAAYFRNLQVGLGLLTSDAELQSDGSTSGFVGANTNFNTFAANFISSMIAMGNVEVLTGTAGQIRTNCHAFNS
jgi:peroxidase